MSLSRYDVAVFGAGSGGIGTALSAARLGLSVLWVERAASIGGTAVHAGVHVWEAGAGGTGIPFDLYRRLKRLPGALGIYSYGRHMCWPRAEEPVPFPGGEQIIDPSRRYLDTLQKYGSRTVGGDEAFAREHFHGVVFEPDALARVTLDAIEQTGRCRLRTGVQAVRAKVSDGRVLSVELDNGEAVEAAAYVDATGDGSVCLTCGSAAMDGREPRSVFDEPDAPEHAEPGRNAVTLIYRVTPTDRPAVEPQPAGVPAGCWWRDAFPAVSATQYPCGDFNMNMLPTMEGTEFAALGREAALRECRRRVAAHWHHLQTSFPDFRSFRLSWTAPWPGVRETRRIAGEAVLDENAVLAGIRRQSDPDIIALSDHALDRHGEGGGYRGLDQPYGIPYRCLIPAGFRNLLIACRAASFSSLAASSCRLSRTMMQLGQAAGTAVALAHERSCMLPEVPAADLREALRQQHVQLDWPVPADLRRTLEEE